MTLAIGNRWQYHKNDSCCGKTPAMLRQARTVFVAFTQMVKSPFALSSLRSGRVEGFRTCQLPFLGLTFHDGTETKIREVSGMSEEKKDPSD